MAYSKAKRDYNAQYIKDNIKRIPLDVQKEHYERIKAAAGVTGESVNGYIKRSIDERMERDGGEGAAPGTAPVERVTVETPAGRPQGAAETAQGAGVVSLPSDTLEAVYRAAHAAGESVPDFIRRAVENQAMRDSGGPSSMIVLTPELVQDATVGGFAVGETTRAFVMRAVRELVERERPDWDDETLRFQELGKMAVEKGIMCLPPGALESIFGEEAAKPNKEA